MDWDGLVTTDTPLAAQQVPPQQDTCVAETWHTLVLILIVTVWASLGFLGTHGAKTTQKPNLLFTYGVTAAWEWLVVAYIAWGIRRRGMRFRELLGNRWKNVLDFVRDFGISVMFWIWALVVLAFAGFSVDIKHADNSQFALLPQTHLEMLAWILLSTTAGICEEVIFRGYFQKQFIAWTGNVSAGVVISALIFGAAHIYAGVKPAVVITVYGLLFGLLAQWRTSLIPGMMTHAWHDAFSGLAAGYLMKFLPK
jgi:membrane protease YdiL (CAAX protease family)